MSEEFAYTTQDRLVQDFVSRGVIVLSPDDLGVSPDIHSRIYTQEKAIHDAREPVTCGAVPEVLDIINAPGVVAACNQLLGENWAIVPFTHNASFTSGAMDQAWHKDDNGPYNSRKQRHHQPVQIEMLYYPQAVADDMGPTATAPYSQYWTFNHEENNDNFAGADHLDFEYQIKMQGIPVSGPDSEYEVDDIVGRRTAHDVRMRDAITDLQWPLTQHMEAAPLRAGSVVIYSHNTFHRGNHRRDDWRTWPDNPRFMWRFWLYRTTEPGAAVVSGTPPEIGWNELGRDPMTGVDLAGAGNNLTSVWHYQHHWTYKGHAPPARADAAALATTQREQEAERLFAQMHLKNDESEPARIGAAYQLASIGDPGLAVQHLSKALYTDRENVRRAATYGLVAVGEDATETFLQAAESPIRWVRKAGVYGLGDASALTETVVKAVTERLATDTSAYVRSVAAGSLGCLGRRAAGTGVGEELIPQCLQALVQSLAVEENRLSMDRVQQRSIKMVRPTDDCDVCEGNGVDFGLDRFKPVRSVVRENALWSIVILSSHGAAVTGTALDAAISSLKTVIETDENVICVGLAMDALNRLANLQPQGEQALPAVTTLQAELPEILAQSPLLCWEALTRASHHRPHIQGSENDR